jgi:hypothetical protein
MGDEGDASDRRSVHGERHGGRPEKDHPASGDFKAPPVRPHPKPALDDSGSVGSLNDAVRRELWYLDTAMAVPFRVARRWAQGSQGAPRSAIREGLDELLWAAEGVTRMPVKFLQAAVGDPAMSPKGGAKP